MKFPGIITFLLIILLKTALSDVPPSIVIDSLSGRAEIQRESSFEWQLVSAGEKLFNNDQLRLLPTGHIRLKIGDSSRVFICQNSQFKVNLLKSSNSLISHFTLISGAAFFNVSNSRTDNIRNTLFVHTPSIKATPYDCSFLVSLLPDRATEIRLLQGTLPISKTKDGSSHYLTPPYIITVGSTNDSFQQSVLLQHDIDSLKSSIPAFIVDQIMEKQLINLRRNSQILSDKPKDKCLIAFLKNKSNYKGNWNIEKIISWYLTQKLNSGSTKIITELLDSTCTDLFEIALSKKARFLITGEISSFELLQQAIIASQTDKYQQSIVARVKLEISLTETSSGKVLMSETFTGEITQKRKKEKSLETLLHLPFDLQDSSFSSSIIGLAITQTIDQTTKAILPVLESR